MLIAVLLLAQRETYAQPLLLLAMQYPFSHSALGNTLVVDRVAYQSPGKQPMHLLSLLASCCMHLAHCAWPLVKALGEICRLLLLQ